MVVIACAVILWALSCALLLALAALRARSVAGMTPRTAAGDARPGARAGRSRRVDPVLLTMRLDAVGLDYELRRLVAASSTPLK